jgi:hypothetical protein
MIKNKIRRMKPELAILSHTEEQWHDVHQYLFNKGYVWWRIENKEFERYFENHWIMTHAGKYMTLSHYPFDGHKQIDAEKFLEKYYRKEKLKKLKNV